jgi:hypothetical protein
VLRWGLLVGGLVIIADLATRAFELRSGSTADVNNMVEVADLIINIVLFSFVGAAVFRETGQVSLGALAGLLAGLVDALVIAASMSMAPRTGDGAPEELILWNMGLGTIFAALSAGLNRLLLRRTGSGPR